MDAFSGSVSQFVTLENPTLSLLLLLVIVWTTGVICRIIKQPPVLGELTAGIIFGPALLGVLVPNEMIDILAELGCFFPHVLRRAGNQPHGSTKATDRVNLGRFNGLSDSLRAHLPHLPNVHNGNEFNPFHLYGDVNHRHCC